MTYNIDEIKSWFEGCAPLNNLSNEDFGEETEECYEIIDFLREAMNFRCPWNYGATKLVLAPHNKDYVIKIPFKYEYVNDDEPYCGAYKIGLNEQELNFGWDYCGLEEALYQKAKERGIEKLFAETKCIGEYLGHPIYIQEKCTIFNYSKDYSNYSLAKRKRSEKLCNDNDFPCFHSCWLSDVLDYYETEHEFIELNKFIKDFDIRDLHSGNVGYKADGCPVLVDYSDFNS